MLQKRALALGYCRRIFCNRVPRRNHRCPGVLETQQLPPITIGSAVVEWVDSFKYLGHVLNSDLSDSLDFETRIRKAQAMYGAISKFLNVTGKHLFRAFVEATLMHGGVLWSLSAAERSRLNAFQMKCLRGICRPGIEERACRERDNVVWFLKLNSMNRVVNVLGTPACVACRMRRSRPVYRPLHTPDRYPPLLWGAPLARS